jgi:hypothetical protein
VLDAAGFMRAVIACLKPEFSLPEAILSFETDAGDVTLESNGTTVRVVDALVPDSPVIHWPSAALAQLVTGYRSVDMLTAIHNTAIPERALVLLRALFSPGWRLSRNES